MHGYNALVIALQRWEIGLGSWPFSSSVLEFLAGYIR